MATTLISSGRVIDGSGGTAYDGSVLIDGDKISAVLREGEPLPAADVVIDARGRAIAPGFIDMHSHADWVLPLEDHAGILRCLLEQGVTTVVAGNCGISPAPVRTESVRRLEGLAAIAIDEPFEYEWSEMGEYLDRIEGIRPVVNVAELVGHAAIRYAHAETRRGRMTPEELRACEDAVRRAFDAGARGLSFGLGYDPGMYSPLDEIEALCRVAAAADRTVTVHLKAFSRISPCYPVTTLGAHNLRALGEMLRVAQAAGARLQLSHFIFVGRKSWATAERSLEKVEESRRQGLDVMIDAFPYTCGNTTVNVSLPYWFLKTLPEGYSSRLARARLRAELEIGYRLVGFTYRDFQVMDAGVPGLEEIDGLAIPEVARRWGVSCFDALLRLSEMSHGAALMLYHAYSGEPGYETPLETVLSQETCLFETDAVVKSRGYPNPAALGTFPRILGELVRERKLFTLEEAVRRMTSESAARFGLGDRGRLAPGMAADVTIFDPRVVSDSPPAGRTPAGRPKGILHVLVNGVKVVENGLYLAGAERSGAVLRA